MKTLEEIKQSRIEFLNRQIKALSDDLDACQNELNDILTDGIKVPKVSWTHNNTFVQRWTDCELCGSPMEYGELEHRSSPAVCEDCLEATNQIDANKLKWHHDPDFCEGCLKTE